MRAILSVIVLLATSSAWAETAQQYWRRLEVEAMKRGDYQPAPLPPPMYSEPRRIEVPPQQPIAPLPSSGPIFCQQLTRGTWSCF